VFKLLDHLEMLIVVLKMMLKYSLSLVSLYKNSSSTTRMSVGKNHLLTELKKRKQKKMYSIRWQHLKAFLYSYIQIL